MRGKALLTATAALGLLALSGCALSSSGAGSAPAANTEGPLKGLQVSVGSKQFTEQLILCEITAQRLASQGADVKRVCAMSGSDTVRAALTSGDINLYWEYTGTGWINHLKQTKPVPDATEQYEKVRDMDLSKNKIVWLPPATANNTYAVGVKTATAEKLGVKTISDYAALTKTNPGDASFCGAAEFMGRNDGWAGLKERYGIALADSAVATLAEGPIYSAVAAGNPCNFGEVTTTDGRLTALGITTLKDDKAFFPFYTLSLTAKQDFLEKNPQVKAVMEPVTKKLTNEVLQKLNTAVDVDGKTPEAVAKTFLSEGL